MAAYPRSHYVVDGEIATYHAWSRCVQQAYLCGIDPHTGANFDHRRDWIEQLLEYQAGIFAIDVGNYNILCNHEHFLLRTRPDISADWSDEEVAWRWKKAWPTWKDGHWERSPTDEEIRQVLSEPDRLPELRKNLASLSWFMARVKEPIAKLANQEMQRTGHFFEQRYKCRRLEDAPAVLTCSIYLDINQLAAGMADSLQNSRCSGIARRVAEWLTQQVQESLEAFHTDDRPDLQLRFEDLQHLFNGNFLSPITHKGPLIIVGDISDHPKIIAPETDIVIPGLAVDLSAAASTRAAEAAVEPAQIEAEETGNIPGLDEQQSLAGADTNMVTTADENIPQPPSIAAQSALITLAEGSSSDAGTSAAISATAEGKKGRRVRKKIRLSRDERSAAPPTYEIHRRQSVRARKRASDNPYLETPPEQYLALAAWTAERVIGENGELKDLPSPASTLLASQGIVAKQWLACIGGFDEIFHSAVGSPRNLQAFIERAGRKTIHGIRACRAAFT